MEIWFHSGKCFYLTVPQKWYSCKERAQELKMKILWTHSGQNVMKRQIHINKSLQSGYRNERLRKKTIINWRWARLSRSHLTEMLRIMNSHCSSRVFRKCSSTNICRFIRGSQNWGKFRNIGALCFKAQRQKTGKKLYLYYPKSYRKLEWVAENSFKFSFRWPRWYQWWRTSSLHK